MLYLVFKFALLCAVGFLVWKSAGKVRGGYGLRYVLLHGVAFMAMVIFLPWWVATAITVVSVAVAMIPWGALSSVSPALSESDVVEDDVLSRSGVRRPSGSLGLMTKLD